MKPRPFFVHSLPPSPAKKGKNQAKTVNMEYWKFDKMIKNRERYFYRLPGTVRQAYDV